MTSLDIVSKTTFSNYKWSRKPNDSSNISFSSLLIYVHHTQTQIQIWRLLGEKYFTLLSSTTFQFYIISEYCMLRILKPLKILLRFYFDIYCAHERKIIVKSCQQDKTLDHSMETQETQWWCKSNVKCIPLPCIYCKKKGHTKHIRSQLGTKNKKIAPQDSR